VEGIIQAIVSFLQQGIAAIFKFLQLVWTWSFGQIVSIFSSDWQSLDAFVHAIESSAAFRLLTSAAPMSVMVESGGVR